MHDTYVKRVSHRSTESRGFSPGTPLSSHGHMQGMLSGWVIGIIPLTDRPFQRSCAPRSDISHNVAAIYRRP